MWRRWCCQTPLGTLSCRRGSCLLRSCRGQETGPAGSTCPDPECAERTTSSSVSLWSVAMFPMGNQPPGIPKRFLLKAMSSTFFTSYSFNTYTFPSSVLSFSKLAEILRVPFCIGFLLCLSWKLQKCSLPFRCPLGDVQSGSSTRSAGPPLGLRAISPFLVSKWDTSSCAAKHLARPGREMQAHCC